MLFFAKDDEQDENLDEDEQGEDEDAPEDLDEEEDSDDDAGDESDDSEDDESDEEDEDNKPVTRKELREMLKSNKNRSNANRRISQKDNKGRDTKQTPDTIKRLETLEQAQRETALLEKKRDFGYQNGLSPKQVNYVFRLTKRPTPAFINKPHVKASLDVIASQEKLARNTPTGSGKRFKGGGGDKKWTDLKPEERQSSLADRRREILERKRG